MRPERSIIDAATRAFIINAAASAGTVAGFVFAGWAIAEIRRSQAAKRHMREQQQRAQQTQEYKAEPR